MNEKDLNNINEIDTECKIFDDDDDTFKVSDVSSTDDRQIQSKTGIIIDFNDADDGAPMRAIKADISMKNPGNIDIKSDFLSCDFEDYNAIDMETTSWDEDDDYRPAVKKSNPIFMNSDDEESGLIASEMLEESKKSISYGEVEDDYWKKISKKHQNTNKKGAYNTSFHFAGNPELEKDMFNHMMGTSSTTDVAKNIPSNSLLSAVADIGASANTGGNITGASGGEGCSESLNKNDYSRKLYDLFDTIGFEVFRNSDTSYVAIDKCDILPTINASDLNELIAALRPYLEDCLIYPLQIITNVKLNTYKDWSDWYTDDMQKQFPKCASDIAYCDLLANHLPECTIE